MLEYFLWPHSVDGKHWYRENSLVVELMEPGSPSMKGPMVQVLQILLDEQKNGVRRLTSIGVGPFGGQGGINWDDGQQSGILKVTLTHGECIDSISFVYDKNGERIKSEKHGGAGGSATAKMNLDFPHEYLVSVSGHYATFNGPVVFRSLTFKTNRRTFGPYGKVVGTPFSFPMDGGKIVGFRGRSGRYLDAIGFHLLPV